MQQQLEAALDALLNLRAEIMRVAPDNAEVRSDLRRVICRIDDLVQRSGVPDRGYENTIRWLSMFLDVEHGMMLKTLANSPDTTLIPPLDQYVRTRSKELFRAESTRPAAMKSMRHCYGLLGKKVGEADDDNDRLPRELSRLLETHLEDDAHLRKDLNGLVSAMQDLLTEVTRTIQGLGEESVELTLAADLLRQDIPDDPKAVQSLLRNAREGILAAGRRIGESGNRLRRAVKEQTESVKMLQDRLSKAEDLAAHDPLTGLANRRELDHFISSMQEEGEAALLMIDIDHFKRINDQHGHTAGDEVLANLAKILTDNIRATDIVARIGGEEFIVVLPGLSRSQAHHTGESLRRAVHVTGFKCQVGKLSVTISIGAATRLTNESARDWIKRADQALYNAKNAGRNCIWYADYF